MTSVVDISALHNVLGTLGEALVCSPNQLSRKKSANAHDDETYEYEVKAPANIRACIAN
jgi:hypothetical protein